MPPTDLYCKLCGKKGVRQLPSQRIWHQTCPKRGPKAQAPEYVERADPGTSAAP